MDKKDATMPIATNEVYKHLDIILDTLKLSNAKSLVAICKDNIDQTMTVAQVDEYIEELFGKGFIKPFNEFESGHRRYFITVKGRVFEGYVNQHRRLQSEKQNGQAITTSQMKLQKDMVVLTRILAIGTCIAALYYLIEIIKNFCSYH